MVDLSQIQMFVVCQEISVRMMSQPVDSVPAQISLVFCETLTALHLFPAMLPLDIQVSGVDGCTCGGCFASFVERSEMSAPRMQIILLT